MIDRKLMRHLPDSDRERNGQPPVPMKKPLLADERDFYKVEKLTKDDTTVDRMLYAGSDLGRAREIFEAAITHRPRIRLTIRHGSHLLEKWPK